MEETIKGWIARNRGGWAQSYFFSKKPKFYIESGFYVESEDCHSIVLKKHHGLKPGQIKKAKMTIEVE